MGGGGIKQTTGQLSGIASQQQQAGTNLGAQGQGFIGQGSAEQLPLIHFYQSLINGDSTATQQALAPALGNLARSTTATRQQIMDSTAPGAARDYALASVNRDQGSQVAGLQNQAFLSAFPGLASIGGQNINSGLQLTGAGINSTGNAAGTTNTLLQNQKQDKAQTMSTFGQLAGVAGNIATGGLSGALTGLFKSGTSGSAGGGGSPYTTYVPSMGTPVQGYSPVFNTAPGYIGSNH